MDPALSQGEFLGAIGLVLPPTKYQPDDDRDAHRPKRPLRCPLHSCRASLRRSDLREPCLFTRERCLLLLALGHLACIASRKIGRAFLAQALVEITAGGDPLGRA